MQSWVCWSLENQLPLSTTLFPKKKCSVPVLMVFSSSSLWDRIGSSQYFKHRELHRLRRELIETSAHTISRLRLTVHWNRNRSWVPPPHPTPENINSISCVTGCLHNAWKSVHPELIFYCRKKIRERSPFLPWPSSPWASMSCLTSSHRTNRASAI